MPLISVTRLRLRSWLYFPAFSWRADRSAKQAAAADRNLAAAVLFDRGKAFWTLTAWSSEPAMKSFMTAGAHGAAMRKLLEWCDESAFAHWTQDTSDLPTWEQAHARLQREGRRSKVNHPSAAHTAFVIPAPVVRPRRAQRMK